MNIDGHDVTGFFVAFHGVVLWFGCKIDLINKSWASETGPTMLSAVHMSVCFFLVLVSSPIPGILPLRPWLLTSPSQALGHSLSGDVGSDGIFIPPVPHELMQGLPNCYSYWPLCLGDRVLSRSASKLNKNMLEVDTWALLKRFVREVLRCPCTINLDMFG